MRVELLAVGSELLLGDIVNTNASWLGQRLAAGGIDVDRSVAVGDNIGRVVDCLRAALDRADDVIVTGGLGPTQDDLTREALAQLAGVELRRDAELERALRDRFAASGRTVPERNFRQADVPVGATALPNAAGTAPGLRLELAGRVVYALPGVPHEMTAMYDAEVAPDLARRAGQPAILVSRVIRTAGIWESQVAEALAALVEELERRGNPTIAFLAAGGQTRVRISAKAADPSAAAALIDPVEARVRAALGAAVYGADEETLDGAVHALLRARRETVAVAESLTGGLLGAALSAQPGASDNFVGGITAYSTPLKAVLLDVGVPVLAQRGAVSAEVASAMAVGVRRRLDATYGLALTGVAGPQEQDGQPVGTVFAALACPGGGVVRPLRLGRAGGGGAATLTAAAAADDRDRIRTYAVVAALDLLRRHLLALSPPG
jgi:nicotinamide-nucleotide amidase